jgi:hypothetical protein
MSLLTEAILSATHALPEGGLLSPKEFLHLASRAAVDQALARLTREGMLLRVGRGLYTAPVQGRFGVRPPSTESVVQAIEASCGETIVASGAAEANALGLSTQVPTREVFFTSGRARTLQLGNRRIELRHGSKIQLLLGRRLAGMALRALSWLGPEHGPFALTQLRAKLPADEWQLMQTARKVMPAWMARAVSMEGGSFGG